MEAGGRYAAFVGGMAAKEVHLKHPITTGTKGLTVPPILRMKRQQVILPPHLCNTDWGYSKTLFSQALIKAFLPCQEPLIS